MVKKKNKEPSFWTAFIVTIAVFLLVPLPFALYLGGTEWIINGAHEVPKEFIASYIVGFVVFAGGLVLQRFKDRNDKKDRNNKGGKNSN